MLNSRGIFRCLSWNVESLLSKLDDPEFIPYLQSFSFVCLTETFVEYFDDFGRFSDFDIFVSPAQKLSHRGRRSGGVVCLLRTSHKRFVKPINCDCGNILVFRVCKELFHTVKDFLLFCVYVPPSGSPFYDDKDISDGITILEQCIIDMIEVHGDCSIMLMGDFNARTGFANACFSCELQDVECDVVEQTRTSRDRIVNTFGKSLLSLCLSFGLSIVNGNVAGDVEGMFTYLSSHGNSVIDYLIMSVEALPICKSLKVIPNPLSSHMCIEIDLETSDSVEEPTPNNHHRQTRLTWDERFAQLYVENLRTHLETNGIWGYVQDPNIDVNLVTDIITKCLVEAADFMMTSHSWAKPRSRFPWYDKECAISKRGLNNLLHKYTRSLSRTDRAGFIRCRNNYKQLIRRKKKEYRQKVTTTLQNNLTDPNCFWKQIKQLNGSKFLSNNIPISQWYDHFVTVFETPERNCNNEKELVGETENSESARCFETSTLNSEISEEEIKCAVKNLKNNKSAGPDHVIGEMLKHSICLLMPYVKKLFNEIFSAGKFPNSWSESTIIPLHKKGCPSNPNNYRGIFLTSVFSKIFTSILNTRLQIWANMHDLIAEEQCGFRKGYCTVDNIYILHEVIRHYLNKKKKLYVCFIDFKKAFDTVDRRSLWIALENNGIQGKMAAILKDMYRSVQGRVRCNGDLSDFFSCPNGLKQGCKLSPILFSYLVNEITKEIVHAGKHGVQLLPELTQLFLLLFADDIVLISDTVLGLQNQLNVLRCKSVVCGLSANMEKSKVMVFRLGGYLANHEKWNLGDSLIEVVNEYKYLGIKFSTKLANTSALSDLAARGKSACIQIFRMLFKLNNTIPGLWFKLFDAQVQPILLYGAEVWGLDSCSLIENVHLYFMKRYLNVSSRTPNTVIYGELGRYPLYINARIRSVRYWLKLLRMSSTRYPRKVYKMLLNRVYVKDNWVTKLKDTLLKYGFGTQWSQQIVQNDRAFLQDLRTKMIDEFNVEWSTKLLRSPRFSVYALFKQERCLERYLNVVTLRSFRDVLVKFRVGISDIFRHKYRYNNAYTLVCPCCTEADEDEIHVLLQCPVYDDLRTKYLGKFKDPPNLDTFKKLLSSVDDNHIKQLTCLLYHIMKRRKEALSICID